MFKVIFENSDFVIIEKFGGISFEGEDGLLNSLRKDFDSIYGIHRLDKDTSGLMIFAKNKTVQSDISKLFQDRLVQKFYFAISEFRPKKKMGTIKGDLVKSRGGSYKLTKGLANPSNTKFKSCYFEDQSLRGFILKPLTGQTHQLRVHLKSIGSSILGDKRYGCTESDRMYLASVYLSFDYKNELYMFYKYPEEGELYKKVSFEGGLAEMVNNFNS
jgi:tRNA pseudouridine32 synthase/23S rRNA pseudouridine746 synthase